MGTSLLPPTRGRTPTGPQWQADGARPTDVAASQRRARRLVGFVLLVVIGGVIGGVYGLLSAWLFLYG